MDEQATVLGREAGFTEAANRMADLYQSPTIDILSSTREDELDAIGLMRKFAERVSFADCVSFAIMRRQRVRTAFTFDRHFRPKFGRLKVISIPLEIKREKGSGIGEDHFLPP